MSKLFSAQKYAVAISALILILLALQYPLSSSFPIGGDAASYVQYTQIILNGWRSPLYALQAFTQTWYPLAYLTLAPFAILPVEWPIRFIWWAALGQIASGLSLGWLLYRMGGWRQAAAGIAFWALLPVTAFRHFEDATIAQLWSYAFLFIFLERLYAKKALHSLIFLLLVIASHAITGAIAILAIFSSLLPLWIFRRSIDPKSRSIMTHIATATAFLIAIGTYIAITRPATFSIVTAQPGPIGIFEHTRSLFVPLALLSLAGITPLINKLKQQRFVLVITICFLSVLTLVGINQILEINVWTHRTSPYFIISSAILFAFAWPYLMNLIFTNTKLRSTFTALFFTAMLISAWQQNSFVYNYYESSSRYARVHPDELSAMYWVRNNTYFSTIVYASQVNRHSEWIPLITRRNLNPTDNLNQLLSSASNFSINNPNYLMIFHNREDVPQPSDPSIHLVPEFTSQGADVYRIQISLQTTI